MFMIDLVGNTICADLLDYARRDADNAGLRVQFDDRFLRYLCVASVGQNLSPTRGPCIRTAIQIFAEKMRHDVLSEMSGILKARYLISERILFHPTKCAVGAMLGTIIQLVGLRSLPPWMQALGDSLMLNTLNDTAIGIESCCQEIASGGGNDSERASITQRLWPVDPRTGELVEMCLVGMSGDARVLDHNLDEL